MQKQNTDCLTSRYFRYGLSCMLGSGGHSLHIVCLLLYSTNVMCDGCWADLLSSSSCMAPTAAICSSALV